MYIRKVLKKTKNSERYVYRLVESYRTVNGPRQRTLLTLKNFTLDESKWKLLADTIEAFLRDQMVLFLDDDIRFLAEHYSNLIKEKRLREQNNVTTIVENLEPDYKEIVIKSLKHHKVRTIGAEHIALSAFRELELDKFFRESGFTQRQEMHAALSIVGRLVYPGSENSIRLWAQHLSGLDTLLNYSFKELSNNSLYRIADKIYKYKDKLEDHLNQKERDLFNLQEKLVFYDLTNTYIVGSSPQNTKAKFGKSKEKRSDCRLITLGLIIDEYGCPKASKVMPGNQYEAESLLGMIAQLEGVEVSDLRKPNGKKKNKTVITDAGISTIDNLKILQEYGYDYICVARSKPFSEKEIKEENLKRIVSTGKNSIDVQLFYNEDENILYCRSFMKRKKEQAMLENYQKKFESELQAAKASLVKKR